MATEIFIYDIIGEDFFGEGVTAKNIRDEVADVADDERILLRINSPGGMVFEAAAIISLLSAHPGGVDAQIDGVAASAASYIAMVSSNIAMSDGAMLMIHNPWSVVIGDASDMRHEAELLDKINGNLEDAYVRKSGMKKEAVKDAMDAETWYTATEATEAGLADSIIDTAPAAFTISEKFGYRNTPSVHRNKLPHELPASIAAMKRKLLLTKAAMID